MNDISRVTFWLLRVLKGHLLFQWMLVVGLSLGGVAEGETLLVLGIFIPLLTLLLAAAAFKLGGCEGRSIRYQPVVWVALSYSLAALNQISWEQPTSSECLKWIVLTLVATLITGASALWLYPGKQKPGVTVKIVLVGLVSSVITASILGASALNKETELAHYRLLEESKSHLELLAAQMEGGQDPTALFEIPVPNQVAIFNSEGVLNVYRGDLEYRSEVKKLGWNLPSPSGELIDKKALVVWRKMDSGMILLARHPLSGTPFDFSPILWGTLLSILLAAVLSVSARNDVSRSLKTTVDALEASISNSTTSRDSNSLVDPAFRSLVREARRRTSGLFDSRDKLQVKLWESEIGSAQRQQKVVELGQSIELYKTMQGNLDIDFSLPVFANHLREVSQAEQILIYFYESGRKLLVYGEPSQSLTEPKARIVLRDETGAYGHVDFLKSTPLCLEVHHLEKIVSRFSTLFAHLRKAKEQDKLCHILHTLLEPKIEQLNTQLQVATKYQPSKLLSGDLIDVFPVNEERYMVLLADVLGKGSEAAATALRAKEIIRFLANQEHSPSEIVSALNLRLCVSGSRMMTVFLASIDTREGLVSYCSAGHEDSYLLDSRGNLTTLPSNSMMAGVLEDTEFSLNTQSLEADSRLLVFSDGVSEAKNETGQMFGTRKVRHLLQASKSANHLVERLYYDLELYCSGEFSDDLSILAVDIAINELKLSPLWGTTQT